jgi:hypothetical protein
MLFQVKVNETRENNKTFLLKLYEILEVSFAVNRLKNIKVLSIGQVMEIVSLLRISNPLLRRFYQNTSNTINFLRLFDKSDSVNFSLITMTFIK